MPTTAQTARIIPNDGTRETYPTSDVHTWQAFAGYAIEFEGYNDAMVFDAGTGHRLYVPNLPKAGPDQDAPTLAVILRAIADAVEATGFSGE